MESNLFHTHTLLTYEHWYAAYEQEEGIIKIWYETYLWYEQDLETADGLFGPSWASEEATMCKGYTCQLECNWITNFLNI